MTAREAELFLPDRRETDDPALFPPPSWKIGRRSIYWTFFFL